MKQNYQSVDYNAQLGKLCVILSLKGKTTVNFFKVNFCIRWLTFRLAANKEATEPMVTLD